MALGGPWFVGSYIEAKGSLDIWSADATGTCGVTGPLRGSGLRSRRVFVGAGSAKGSA